jgi:hypothetical protein
LRVRAIVLHFATALRKRICAVSIILIYSFVDAHHLGTQKTQERLLPYRILARFIFNNFLVTCSLRFQKTVQQFHINTFIFSPMSRGSSGSIVSDYGLDDRAIEVLSPTGTDFSSSPCVHTGSGAHPASYPMGTGGSFPGGKARPGRDADHSPLSSAEVKNE